MDALVYGAQGLRRAETMSANECRAMLEMAGVSYADTASLQELRELVRKVQGGA